MREDWIECKFADVLNIKNGKNQKLVENPEGIYPIYGSSGIIGWADEYLCEEETTIIGRKGTINTPIFVNTKFWNVDTAFGLTPYKILNSRLLFYFCKLFNFHALDKSTTIPSLAKSDLLQIDFTLPPLPEQRAIVKKLESLFSSLDAGVADLKKAQQQLKIYRQAVLKKAFEGELTNIKIENLVPIGQNVIVNPRPPKEGFDDDIECQFVPMKLVEPLNNKIHLEESAVFNTLKGKSYTYFETGDVIFAKVTPCMENGKIAVAKDLKNGVALGSSEFHVFRCNDELLNDYLFYFIVQDKFRSDAERAMTGAVGLRRVPKKFIEDYEIPLPSIAKQKAVVKQIESRLSVCDSIEQNIKESLIKAEALRQSILKKAFEGNLLTAQELVECKLAEDYEPASVLLERIKAEQNKATAKSSKKKQH